MKKKIMQIPSSITQNVFVGKVYLSIFWRSDFQSTITRLKYRLDETLLTNTNQGLE